MRSIKEILMSRDDMSSEEANQLIKDATESLNRCLEEGDMNRAELVCEEWFGLEPDYIYELI